MNTYKQNIKWLIIFSPFTLLPFSGAFVVPFFLHEGLTQTQVFLLQSVYAITFLAWNIPSGLLADKFGRATSIKVGAPIAAAAMILYGQGSEFWQFALCEAGLAIGEGLIQGADDALLIDSLAHEKRGNDYVKLSQRIKALGWVGAALGVPIAMLFVSKISLGATLTADGCLIAIGALISLKLHNPPLQTVSQEATDLTAWRSLKIMFNKTDVRWLIILTVSLGAATYLAFWLVAQYYQSVGVPVVLFGLIFALRSVWKAWLSHRFYAVKSLRKANLLFAALSGLAFLGMATKSILLVWVVLAHDVVEALQTQPLVNEINKHITPRYRATMNSAIELIRRTVYIFVGPIVGLAVDHFGISAGLVLCGIGCSAIAVIAIQRLQNIHAAP